MSRSAARSWALPLTAAAQFVLALDFSIVNVALATIQHELGFTGTALQWVATGYALTFGALLLVGGRLGDRLGYRRTLVIGLLIFGVSSLAGGLAPTAVVLVIARLVQGAGAALVAPAALALLNHAYDDVASRARAMSTFQGSVAIGASAGIVLGGLLTGLVGWRWVLLVNIPIVAVLVVLILRRLPNTLGNRATRLDATSALAVTAALGLLILGVTEGEQNSFASVTSWAPLAAAVLAACGFLLLERRNRADPMVPLNLLREGRGAYLIVTSILGAIVGGYVYFVALYLQQIQGLTPVQTGLALLPATGMSFIVSTQLARRVLPRLGAARQLLIAFLLIGIGQAWLATLQPSSSYLGTVLVGIVLSASGVGFALPAASVAMTSSAPAHQRGVAGALFTTAQQGGSAVGLAILATIAAATHRPGVSTAGYVAVFTVTAVLSGVAILILTASALRGRLAQR
jgi:EmrB/QacA subfamily drug resistance transporter